MLHVEEQGLAIGSDGNAGDFAVFGAYQKAAHRVSRRIGALAGGRAAGGSGHTTVAHLARHSGQHHAVGDVGVGAIVGLNPQQAARVEVQTVGAGEIVHCRQARQVDVGRRVRLGAKQVNIPGKGRGGHAACVFTPADDVAVGVALVGFGGAVGVGVVVAVVARVGRIGLELAARGAGTGVHAVAVVGQGHVGLAVERVHRAPFRAVHLGGAQLVGCQAGVGHYIALVGKRVGRVAGIEAVFAVGEFQPLARAVGVELGHVQRAFVQVFGASGHATVDILGVPHGFGDKLVDVLVARIVAHVHDDRLARHGGCRPGAFVVEAAQGAALGGRGGGVEGIDLDHPAKGVGDVAVVVGGGSARH